MFGLPEALGFLLGIFIILLFVLSLLLPIFVMVIMFRLGDIRETLFNIEERRGINYEKING
jgi:hypothetical protein